jgi:cytochrome b involved in lipid metabolism
MAYFLFATAPAATPAASQNTPSQYTAANTIMNDSFNNKRTDSLPTFTLAEIAAHDTPDDCWIIVNNKIYNVTSYIPTHPGGSKNITDYCGKDATNAFNTKNNGIPHSPQAREMLNNLLVGQYMR